MSFVQLLLLFRSLPLRDLLNYPDDLEDTEAVRLWLAAVACTGDALANMTDTTIDDAVVDAFKSVVEDRTAFEALYGLVLNIFTEEEYDEEYVGVDTDMKSVSQKIGISPTMIIAIVQVVITILKLIRDRRSR